MEMLGISKQLVRCCQANKFLVQKTTARNYRGVVPGCNLPFKLDKPYRFTAYYLVAGIVGFGAPWLVIMHQMLRPYDYE